MRIEFLLLGGYASGRWGQNWTGDLVHDRNGDRVRSRRENDRSVAKGKGEFFPRYTFEFVTVKDRVLVKNDTLRLLKQNSVVLFSSCKQPQAKL